VTLFKITTNNQILPIIDDKEYWTAIDWYFYNNGESYKKILTDTLYFVALVEDGRVLAMSSNPTGLAINPENFVGVDDIYLKEVECEVYEPYIIKDKKEMTLYVVR
jgi:hypothetical protein